MFLDRAIGRAKATPKHLITDRGVQFDARLFHHWTRRLGINQRFGAVGKYGSVAIVERLIRTIKNECMRRLMVPYRRADFEREVALFVDWYSAGRPHEALAVRTPDEV